MDIIIHILVNPTLIFNTRESIWVFDLYLGWVMCMCGMCMFVCLVSFKQESPSSIFSYKEQENWEWKENIHIYQSIYIVRSRPFWFEDWEPDISKVAHIWPNQNRNLVFLLDKALWEGSSPHLHFHVSPCFLIHSNVYFHHSNKMYLLRSSNDLLVTWSMQLLWPEFEVSSYSSIWLCQPPGFWDNELLLFFSHW